jgi:hypothetical protein
MNTICLTFRTSAECPAYFNNRPLAAYFNNWPLVAAAVGETHLVLAHPLNYDADPALFRFFARSTRIFDLLSVAQHPSFADVTHGFTISGPPVPPPRKPPRKNQRKNPLKIDWSPLESHLGQSSEPIRLLMKPCNDVPHLAENQLSLRDVSDIMKGSRVVPVVSSFLY